MKQKFGKSRLIDQSVFDDQVVNPMDGVVNLADAMLLLAVGIMLALIINWQVDITPTSSETTTDASQTTDESQVVAFTEDDIESVDEDTLTGDDEMTELGTVYFDEETGKYYIIESGGGT